MADTDLKSKTDLKTLFIPVIFANGEDDDEPGLTAAANNEIVQFDETVYQPGQPITIVNRKILISGRMWFVDFSFVHWWHLRCKKPMPGHGGRVVTTPGCLLMWNKS